MLSYLAPFGLPVLGPALSSEEHCGRSQGRPSLCPLLTDNRPLAAFPPLLPRPTSHGPS